MKRLSIGIPVLNEAENVRELVRRIGTACARMDPRVSLHEIIFVDDGSTDATAATIQAMRREEHRIKLISFTRTFGHQNAISAAIHAASGDALIIMDGDLQDPPELIPTLVASWLEGADIVYTTRSIRHGETIFKRVSAWIYYRCLRIVSETDIPLNSGDYSLLDSRVLAVLRIMPERARYLRGLRVWTGFHSVSVSYERERRTVGKSKFSLRKMLLLGMSGVLSFSIQPLRLAIYLGFLTFFASIVAGFVVIYLKYQTDLLIPGWASVVIPVFALGGIQLLVLGIVGEYIGRIYEEVRARPLYIVRERVGFEAHE